VRSAGVIAEDPGVIAWFMKIARDLAGPEAVYHASPEGARGPYLGVVMSSDSYPAVEFAIDDDGSFCVVDGEVYDTADAGSHAKCAARSILKSYQRVGPGVLSQIDATAMIVLYDAPEERLVVARDAIGISPAFVSFGERSMHWASSLSDLRRLTPTSDLNVEAFDYFVATGYVPSPWTLTKGHHRLGPGEIAAWHGGVTDVKRYFQLTSQPPPDDGAGRYDVLTERLPSAVRRRVLDIDKTGVLLSGGVDSAVLLALVRQEFGEAPPSFTFRYDKYSGRLNEGDAAKRVAAAMGSQHSEILVDPARIPEQLPRWLDVFGEPFSYGLHSIMLQPIADTGVTDLLSGSGADALYLDGQGLNALRYLRLPVMARKSLAAASRAGITLERAWTRRTAGRTLPLVGRYALTIHGGIWSARTGLTFNTSDSAIRYVVRRGLYRDPSSADLGRTSRRALLGREAELLAGESQDVRLRLMELRFFDADHMHNWNLHAARAHNMAIRSPFAARDLLEAWVKYPATERNKPDIRRLAASLLPESVTGAPKVYQSAPIHDWLRGPLHDWVRDVLHPSNLAKSGIFDGAATSDLISTHMSGRRDIGWAIWNLTVATIWHEGLRQRG